MRRKLVVSAVLIFLGFALVSAGISYLVSLSLVRRDIIDNNMDELLILLDQMREHNERIRERMVILTSGEGVTALVEACLDGETPNQQREAIFALEEDLGLLLYLNQELDRIFIYSRGYVFIHEKETGATKMVSVTHFDGLPGSNELVALLEDEENPPVSEKLITVFSRNGIAFFASRGSLFEFVRSDYSLRLTNPQGYTVEWQNEISAPLPDHEGHQSFIRGDLVCTVNRNAEGYAYVLYNEIGGINSRIRLSGAGLLICLVVTTLLYVVFCRLYAARLMRPLKEMRSLFDDIRSYEDDRVISDFGRRFTGEPGMHRKVFQFYRTAIFPLLIIIFFSFYSFLSISNLNRHQSEARLLGLYSDSLGKTLSGFEVLTKYLSLSEEVQELMARGSVGDVFDELSGILIRSGVFSLDVYGVNFYDAQGTPVYAGGTLSFQESDKAIQLAIDGSERTGVIVDSQAGGLDTISYVSRILKRPGNDSTIRTYEPIGYVELVMKNFIPGRLALLSHKYKTWSGFIRPGIPPIRPSGDFLFGDFPVANTNLSFTLGLAYTDKWDGYIQIILLDLVIVLIQVISVLIVSRAMESRILVPLVGLDKYIRERREGKADFDISSRDSEFIHLAESFNAMMERLRRLSGELREQEVKTHRSELIALQAQINPHFFNNIIASILLLMKNRKIDDAMGMLSATGRHFQGKIFGSRRFITLAEEFDHLRNYVEIQNYRYGGRITTTASASIDTDRYFIPRLLLQPLVENAITHGMGESGDLNIEIAVEPLDGILRIRVEDDGRGMDACKLEEVRNMVIDERSPSHYGLSNVSDRLRLLDAERYSFRISSKAGRFTRITLDLPVREERDV